MEASLAAALAPGSEPVLASVRVLVRPLASPWALVVRAYRAVAARAERALRMWIP